MITALSPSLPTREAIITALQADTDLAQIVAGRIYPGKLPNNPVYPFVFVPTPTGVMQRRDASDGGSEMSSIVHCYATVTSSSPDAESQAGQINAHVVRVLEGIDEIVDGMSISVVPTQDQIIRSGDEADVWHGLVSYTASAS